jgi:hypothetical protein
LSLAVIGCFIFGVAFTSTRSDLNQAKTQLATVHKELTDTKNRLAGVNTELAQIRADFADTKTDLTKTQADLRTASEELSATESELSTTKFSLIDVTRQLDTVKAYNTRMSDAYSSIREKIYQKLGRGVDGEKYITPKDPAIIAQTFEIAGAYSENANERWSDYQRIYQWIVDNIKYYADTNLPILPATSDGELKWLAEYWKMPAETLEDGSGDCEDMANLLASLMMSYNDERYAIWALVIRDSEGIGHVAIAYPVKGDKLSILDPAGNYFTSDYYGSLDADTISSAVGTWLAHWSSEMPGAKITAVYSNTFYQEFAGTQEFIQWAIDRYKD